ncbi:MAG: hypothetical protein ABFR89_12810 [Actinomycetota bacterium]
MSIEHPTANAPVTDEDLARLAREVAARLQAITSRRPATDPHETQPESIRRHMPAMVD